MKRLVILKNGGGELANQLWNYVSVYAYSLHMNVRLQNPSFFEYHRHFSLWRTDGLLTRFLSFWFQGAVRRRGHVINQFWRRLYALYAKSVTLLHARAVCSSENLTSTVTYLPPTQDTQVPNTSTVYFTGWLFRNPEGLRNYRAELLRAFTPAPSITSRIEDLLSTIQASDTMLIGIHFRQGDYATFKEGIFLLTPERMREVLDEYLASHSLLPENVRIFIASDGPVHAEAFFGYKVHISREQAVVDLFMLARCDVIIGSNSSFGHFASWYGNIPHIVATKEPMDWTYYASKDQYFPNKYATLAKV